jgi:glycogen phosphorylase
MKNRKPVWEVERPDVSQTVKYGGHIEVSYVDDMQRSEWVGFTTECAVAVDVLSTGFDTFTVNCVRKWKNETTQIIQPQHRVLKETYFYVSASIYDVIRRFKKTQSEFARFPLKNSFVAFDALTSALSCLELLRILIDEQGLNLHQAWLLCMHSFTWQADNVEVLLDCSVFNEVLPRHFSLLTILAHLSKVSLIKDGSVLVSRLAFVGAGWVIPHSKEIKFKPISDQYPFKLHH